MAGAKISAAKTAKKKAPRNFPFHGLKDAVRVAQTIRDQNAGNPMNSLLVADAMGIAPGSTNYRDILSSSYKYGLTEGTQKATDISLTQLGREEIDVTGLPVAIRNAGRA